MTDKEKLEKIKKLADAMYYAAFNMTTDASLLRKAMNEYHQFIIYQYFKKEPVSDEWIKELRTKLDSMSKEDFKKVFDKYAVDFNEESVSKDLEEAAEEWDESLYRSDAFKAGAKWQKAKDDEEKVLTYKHGFEDCKEHINKVLLSEVLPCFMHGGEADEVVAKLDEVLNQKKQNYE